MGGGERWVMGGVGEGWDGWVSGGGEGWVSVGVGESDSTVYPACTLSQVSRVDELFVGLGCRSGGTVAGGWGPALPPMGSPAVCLCLQGASGPGGGCGFSGGRG